MKLKFFYSCSSQTYSKSLGRSILSKATRRSLKSGRTEDLIDHDEDAKNYSHRTLRYGNSFSTKTNSEERNHDVTVSSHGNGQDNNDNVVESRLNSGGSLFSYKTASNSSPDRRPKSKYVCISSLLLKMSQDLFSGLSKWITIQMTVGSLEPKVAAKKPKVPK